MLSVDGIGKCYNYLLNTCVNGCKGILYLWYHASSDGAVGNIFIEVCACDNRNDAIVVVRIAKHAFLFKAIDKRYII